MPGGPTSELAPCWSSRAGAAAVTAAGCWRRPSTSSAASGVVRLQMWLPEEDAVTGRFLDGAGWAPDGWVRTLDTGGPTIRELRWHTLLDDERDRQRGVQ